VGEWLLVRARGGNIVSKSLAAVPDDENVDKVVEPVKSHRPIEIPRTTVKLLNFAAAQELNPEERDIGFSARVFAQVSLPYRDPKDAEFWERKNGSTTLTVRPALLTRADGSRFKAYPYGLIPRHALTWMATEAFFTKSPELELGKSMTSFMEKIDLAHNGQNAKRLTDGLQALFGSQMSVEGLASNETGHGSMTQYFQIADAVQLWFSNKDEEGNPGLWSSKVTLSDQFFQSIIQSPVPVDLNAMRALGSSPMRLDMYVWISHRMSYLTSPSHVSWAQLNAQFGSQYSRLRAFKDAFLKNLRDVQIIYPELNVEVHQDYLILKPSNTHVPKKLSSSAASKLKLVRDMPAGE
jgi:hypothetical protein